MEGILKLLNLGWASSAIGIIGLLVALLIYRASVVGARPTYQRRALRLIGGDEKALPEEVEIRFRGEAVDRLTKTYVVFWNSGKALLRGSDIVPEDPIQCQFSEGSRILDARVVKDTRAANKFFVARSLEVPHRAAIVFDYLDPGDGAVIELLHTDSKRYPQITGTIKGVPKGCLDWGRLRPMSIGPPFPVRRMRPFLLMMLAIGLLFFLAGFLLPEPALSVSQRPADGPGFTRGMLVIAGVLYAGLPLVVLWFTRRRFPKALYIPELDE